ncbi:hypothetical protein BB427_16485 [Pseudoalteromonas sp. BMB]|uniref:hypothetical protein n=1 Tax=Pseudoalteromonas sp. BMB TaxID=1874619 RepID=UPI00083D9DB1|nr:hypothetical protein [Pseudoalteromonas sp. BMB]ODB35831.1 hypothetical protein BB427_16485 [Pseudoalteromonas sp. BMB]
MFLGFWLFILAFIFVLFFVTAFTCVVRYFKTKEDKYLLRASFWGLLPFGIVALFSILIWLSTPESINRERIIGSYEVDTNFYSGHNADWQKRHYRFEIYEDDSFIFFERLADSSERKYIGKVKWANETPEKWSISMQTPHHVVPIYPILYREKNGFYYVFESQYFGNVFFRKVESDN